MSQKFPVIQVNLEGLQHSALVFFFKWVSWCH